MIKIHIAIISIFLIFISTANAFQFFGFEYDWDSVNKKEVIKHQSELEKCVLIRNLKDKDVLIPLVFTQMEVVFE